MKDAIELLHPSLQVEIERTGDCHGYKYDIQWVNLPGDQEPVTVSHKEGFTSSFLLRVTHNSVVRNVSMS